MNYAPNGTETIVLQEEADAFIVSAHAVDGNPALTGNPLKELTPDASFESLRDAMHFVVALREQYAVAWINVLFIDAEGNEDLALDRRAMRYAEA
jgi:hypothetical protein